MLGHPHPLDVLVQHEAVHDEVGRVVGQLVQRGVEDLVGQVVRHGHVRVVREQHGPPQDPGAHACLEHLARGDPLGEGDEDDGRHRPEGPGAAQPDRERLGLGRRRAQVLDDLGEQDVVDGRRRQQRDVGRDRVGVRVAEAPPDLGERGAVRLGQRDRDTEHAGGLLRCGRCCHGAAGRKPTRS
jgi:hypothetical protein